MRGTLGILPVPTSVQMAAYSERAYLCSPLRKDAGAVGDWPAGNPIPKKVGDKGPIKHCIYIIKENRTYDQVFGDMKEGNGDPSLCLFGEKVTPNHHRLSRQFVLLDNFYVEGEVSADGHQWSMGAYATDFVEKVWPLNYRGSPLKKLSSYPSEGEYDSIARPAGGYLWDRAKEASVSYRSYGEWVTNGKKRADGTYEDATVTVKGSALEGHIDPKFRGFDMDYPDQKRADRFIEELKRFEKEGKMPQLTILRLPNDHTVGTRVGKPTPMALVADNDLALGRVVEAVSQEQVLEGHGHLRHRGRRPERPRPRGRTPHGGAGGQPVHEAALCGLDHVFNEQHAANDGADPGTEADEPVRRGGAADVRLVFGEAGPDGV